jgi:TPR repeat protein
VVQYTEDRSCLTQFAMGEMFVKGENPRDHKLAAKWYMESAKQGYRKSQRRLGTMYALGYGVPKNYIKSYAWFKVSAAQRSPKAQRNLRKVESRMTAEQIYYARKLAQQYYETFVTPFTT